MSNDPNLQPLPVPGGDPAPAPAPTPAPAPAESADFWKGWHTAMRHIGVISSQAYADVLQSTDAYVIDPPGAPVTRKPQTEVAEVVKNVI